MKFLNKNKEKEEFSVERYKITPEEFLQKKKEQPRPTILDIRPVEDHQSQSVEGSKNLPAERFEMNLMHLPPFGLIILYSDSANTHIQQCIEQMHENGFSEFLWVDGGYEKIMEATVIFHPSARENIEKKLAEGNFQGFRIDIIGRACSFSFVPKDGILDTHDLFDFSGLPVYIQKQNRSRVEGTKINYENDELSIYNPVQEVPQLSGTINEQIQQILDEEINPNVAAHGGFVSLLDVKDDKVFLELGGGCRGCGMVDVTLKQGIEVVIKEKVPEIIEILDVTDHAGGTNPYYQPNVK